MSSNRISSASLRAYLQLVEDPFHYVFQQTARCTECSRPRNFQNETQCNNVPGVSRGPHLQCTQESFHQRATPSVQNWYGDICTECSRPRSYRDRLVLPCNSIPGQSQGPHLQSSEESFRPRVTQTTQRLYRARCTECTRLQNLQDGTPCNSVRGQSRGPHLQCSEDHSSHPQSTVKPWTWNSA